MTDGNYCHTFGLKNEVLEMNKSDLTAKLMEKSAGDFASKASAKRITDAVFDIIKEAVVEGDTVTIVGFGTFKFKEKAEKQGRNPQTGEPMTIPAKKAVIFKAGKEFKDAVNA